MNNLIDWRSKTYKPLSFEVIELFSVKGWISDGLWKESLFVLFWTWTHWFYRFASLSSVVKCTEYYGKYYGINVTILPHNQVNSTDHAFILCFFKFFGKSFTQVKRNAHNFIVLVSPFFPLILPRFVCCCCCFFQYQLQS